MNITKETIKSTLRSIMAEESEYQTFFKKALEKAGKSIPSMSDEEKKAFFDKIDAAWDGKGEKNEGNAFGAAVTAAKEKGEDEFEVGGKTYKVEESVDCGCGCGGCSESVNEGFYKSIMSDGGRNLFFAMVNDKTDEVKTIDAKTWLSSSLMDNASKESKERVVKAILKNEKQFNKKVEFNMWAKKNNPKFAQIMDYFFKNNFIGNITAKGIRVYESVESVNEGRAFINAAKKAKAEGKTEFEFNGKTYPVTIKESVVNEDANMNKKVKAFLDKGLRDLTKGKPNHHFAVMNVLMGALTDANFHSEAKKVPSIFPKAKYEGDPMGKQDVIRIYEEMGENVASICKWDGKDIVDAIGFYVSMTIGRPVGEKVEKLVESVNETIYLLNNEK